MLRLRPLGGPTARYHLCLHLEEDTRLCAIRADDVWTMMETVWPALRRLGPSLSNDIMVWNMG